MCLRHLFGMSHTVEDCMADVSSLDEGRSRIRHRHLVPSQIHMWKDTDTPRRDRRPLNTRQASPLARIATK
jgi:hypothetical protein